MKKGQFLAIIALMSIFLIGYMYFSLVYSGTSGEKRDIGLIEIGIIHKEIIFKQIQAYYEQSFKNAIFKSLNEISNGEEWNKNPYPETKNKFLEKMKENFDFYIKNLGYTGENIKFPVKLDFSVDDKDKLKVTLKTNELEVGDDFNDEAAAKITKKLEFNYIVDFDLKLYDRLYKRYSEWGKEKRCVSESEEFEGNKVTCKEEDNFLNFEVVTKNL